MSKHISKAKKDKILEKAQSMKAQAVKVEEEEYEAETDQKLRTRLHRQEEFCETRLRRIYAQSQLQAFQVKLDDAVRGCTNVSKEEKKKVMMHWDGKEQCLGVLVHRFDLEHFYYRKLCKRENYLKKALMNDGLSDDDIKSVAKGEYIKDERELNDLEKKKPKEKDEGTNQNYMG